MAGGCFRSTQPVGRRRCARASRGGAGAALVVPAAARGISCHCRPPRPWPHSLPRTRAHPGTAAAGRGSPAPTAQSPRCAGHHTAPGGSRPAGAAASRAARSAGGRRRWGWKAGEVARARARRLRGWRLGNQSSRLQCSEQTSTWDVGSRTWQSSKRQEPQAAAARAAAARVGRTPARARPETSGAPVFAAARLLWACGCCWPYFLPLRLLPARCAGPGVLPDRAVTC